MRYKIILLLMLVVGVFAYAVVSRLASEGRALVTGLLIGVFAGAPIGLITGFLASRAATARPAEAMPGPQRPPAPRVPPIVIVSPPQPGRTSRYAAMLDELMESPQPRRFTIVSDEDQDSDQVE